MKRSSSLCLAAFCAVALTLAGCSTTENVSLGADGAPAAVSASFQRSHPDGKISNVRKKVYKDGHVKYNIEYRDSIGKLHDVNYDENGNLVK